MKIQWNAINKKIYQWIQDPLINGSRMERAHKEIHKLVRERGPLNRYELALLVQRHVRTSQPVQRVITDYRAIALRELLIHVWEPEDFIEENPQIEPGPAFAIEGGYTILAENFEPQGNWKLADECILHFQKYGDRIPKHAVRKA